jgi:D-3-phosphoglycerate dehydrogenase
VNPIVAVAPKGEGPFMEAVTAGGGQATGRLKGADALIWLDPDDPRGLKHAVNKHQPKWVQLPFAGIEKFVRKGAIDDGRVWTCAKGIYGSSTAEHALTLMLAASRRLHEHLLAQGWRRGGFQTPERRLHGSTVLIVGTGGIGSALAPMLKPLGVRILAVNRSGKPLEGADVTEPVENILGLVAEADYVVLACPLTEETRGLFDRGTLEYMKPDAWLINVARGPVVVTRDLMQVLDKRRIGGAALDVTDPEPLPIGHPLWEMDNVIITPHVANTWDMALPELTALVTRNVKHFAAGEELEGLVDPSVGY